MTSPDAAVFVRARLAVFDQAENRRHAHQALPRYVPGALPVRRRAKR